MNRYSIHKTKENDNEFIGYIELTEEDIDQIICDIESLNIEMGCSALNKSKDDNYLNKLKEIREME